MNINVVWLWLCDSSTIPTSTKIVIELLSFGNCRDGIIHLTKYSMHARLVDTCPFSYLIIITIVKSLQIIEVICCYSLTKKTTRSFSRQLFAKGHMKIRIDSIVAHPWNYMDLNYTWITKFLSKVIYMAILLLLICVLSYGILTII